jgi:hypothetical protein
MTKVYFKDGDYICELWGGSTKHPDAYYSMNDFIERGQFVIPFGVTKEDDDYEEILAGQVFQWLLCIASNLMLSYHAEELVIYALEKWAEKPFGELTRIVDFRSLETENEKN